MSYHESSLPYYPARQNESFLSNSICSNLQDKAHINAWRLFSCMHSWELSFSMKASIIILFLSLSGSWALKCKSCDTISNCKNPSEKTCSSSNGGTASCFTQWSGMLNLITFSKVSKLHYFDILVQSGGSTEIESRGCSSITPESKTKVADGEWCVLDRLSGGTCWYKGDRNNSITPTSKT